MLIRKLNERLSQQNFRTFFAGIHDMMKRMKLTFEEVVPRRSMENIEAKQDLFTLPPLVYEVVDTKNTFENVSTSNIIFDIRINGITMSKDQTIQTTGDDEPKINEKWFFCTSVWFLEIICSETKF